MAPSDAVDRFLEAARGVGVTVEVQRYPEGTRTAADAAAAVGCTVDQIVKSLILMADGDPVLVLCSGSNQVDEAALASHLEASEVRMATADEARRATGYAIGGTPPFGHLAPLPALIDPHLFSYDTVYAAAGAPDAVFAISADRLASSSGAEAVALTR